MLTFLNRNHGYYFSRINSLLRWISILTAIMWGLSFSKQHSIQCFQERTKQYQNNRIQYQLNWLDNLPVFDTLNGNFEKCPICNIPKRNYHCNSSPNDAIISIAFKRAANIIGFARSLRTTGTLCSVFIFVDEHAFNRLTYDSKTILKNCNIRLINIGRYTRNQNQVVRDRFFVIQDFLIQYQAHLNRIIFVDLFDTVFQADPFPISFSPYSLYLSDEGFPLSISMQNMVWLESLPYELFMNQNIICAGLILGGIDPMLHFLSIYLYQLNNVLPPDLNDQAALNYLYYTGVFSEINIILLKIDSYHVSLAEALDEAADYEFGNFKVSPEFMHTPALLHQFDRNEHLFMSFAKKCPLNESWIISDVQKYEHSTAFTIARDYFWKG